MSGRLAQNFGVGEMHLAESVQGAVFVCMIKKFFGL